MYSLQNRKLVSQAGNQVNEDFACMDAGFALVADGSSGLGQAHITDGGSDAAWFSHSFGRAMELLLRSSAAPLLELAAWALAQLRPQYEAFAGGQLPESIVQPSASLIVMRIVGDRLEYFQLGDCTATLRFQSGETLVLHDNSVSALDQAVIARISAASRHAGISMQEAAAQLRPLLVANRHKKNTPDGYWILDLSGAGLAHGVNRSFPLVEVESLSIMSDGFAQLCDTICLYPDFKSLHQAMGQQPLEALVQALFSAQEEDCDMVRYPRLKFRDDTTALWARCDTAPA